MRTTLAFAAAQDFEINQVDIKTAFLYGELEEDVWTEQPPDYKNGTPGMACHLRKSLYGLKQAPRVWHAKLSEELDKMGPINCRLTLARLPKTPRFSMAAADLLP